MIIDRYASMLHFCRLSSPPRLLSHFKYSSSSSLLKSSPSSSCSSSSPLQIRLFWLNKPRHTRNRAFGTSAVVAAREARDTFLAEEGVSWTSLGVSDRLSCALSDVGIERPSLVQGRIGFCAFASKKRRKGENSILEMDGFDGGGGGGGDDDDEDEDEAMFIPLENMKKWLENKPCGFGEDKEYDTSIEEKLLEEMGQSSQAQLLNMNKLKNNPVQPNSKKDHHLKQKAPEVLPSGIRVRLLNLPKKKKIHRDLQSAFKGVPGIINIIPSVSGNKKTRHPVCKGFAFVDLKSEEDANRFIQIFSRQSITFGKIQKQIKCEITNSCSLNSADEQSAVDDSNTAPQIIVPSLGRHSATDFDMVDSSLDSWEETASDESDGSDDDFVTAECEYIRDNMETFRVSELNGGDSMEPRMESTIDSLPSMQQGKNQEIEEKLVERKKREKVSKLSIPGSANRLKIKDKAVLTGVFTKYGVKTTLASREES